MARLADVSPGDLITSQRQNDINDYIEDGTEYLITKSAQLVGSATAPVDGDLAQGRLYADTSGNLHFYTGSVWKNISGGQTFDCVVAASGGDYTTVGAAITAGKTSIFVKDGTYTETGNVTLPSNCTLVGESWGAIISMGTNIFTTGSQNLLSNITITSTRDGHHSVIGADDVTFFNVYFLNGAAVNPSGISGLLSDNAVARSFVKIIGCKFLVLNSATDIGNRVGLHASGGGTGWFVSDCNFLGFNGDRDSRALYISVLNYSTFTNCMVRYMQYAGADVIYLNGSVNTFSNFTFRDSEGNITIDSSATENALTNFVDDTTDNNMNIVINGDYNHLSNIYLSGSVTVASGGVLNTLIGISARTGFSITGNYCTIEGCRAGVNAGAGTGTITINSGATDTLVIGCRTDAAISDAGTGTVLTSNVVY